MLNLKPIKRTLRNAGFVLDDFATHIDKKQLSFRHPYIYTGMAIAAIGVMIGLNKDFPEGSRHQLQLNFSNGNELIIPVTVQKRMGSMKPMHHMH